MTPTRPRLALGVALLGVLAAAAAAPPAHASHYRLSVSGMVSAAELASLSAAGIETTAALFEAAARVKERRALARASGLSWPRLTELAAQCDLLRIQGIGPSVVRLLQASGVRHSSDLRRLAPDALHARLVATNKAHRLMETLPDPETLAAWIERARALPKVLEGVR